MTIEQKIQELINHIVCGRCPRCGDRLEFMSGRVSAKIQSAETTADGIKNILVGDNLARLHSALKGYYDLDTRLRKQLLDSEDIHPNSPDARIVEEIDRFIRQIQTLIPITRLIDDNIHIAHMLSFLIS
jgi:Ser/Thr protein kinase RdoA (MazF antagonist)